jgi:hypothetical protein
MYEVEPDTEVAVPQAVEESVYAKFDRLTLQEQLDIVSRIDKQRIDRAHAASKQLGITEATGLANRSPGAVFKNAAGEEIVFEGVQFYPEDGGRLEYEQLEELVETLQAELGSISWQNTMTRRMGGVGIATFADAGGNPLYFGRFFEKIDPIHRNNKMDNVVDDYRLVSATAAKERSGLSPADLLDNKDNLTAQDILSQLESKLGTDNSLYQLAVQISQGESLPITIEPPAEFAESFTAFRDYFCEILQPIALQQELFTGNAGEAADIFLSAGLAETTISFHEGKTGGLSDSVMTSPDGKSVKISTKGGKTGAPASVVNIIESLKELESAPGGSEIRERNQEAITIIEEIQEHGVKNAPLHLGEKMGIISAEERQRILSLDGKPTTTLDNILQSDLSDNLKTLAQTRAPSAPDKLNAFAHLLAAVAFEVADQINQQGDFSAAATEILNHSALIQVYTKASRTGDSWTVEQFETHYPGETVHGVYLWAAKTYTSTRQSGNFTFVIDREGSGPPRRAQQAPPAAQTQPERKPNRRARELEPQAAGELGREKVESTQVKERKNPRSLSTNSTSLGEAEPDNDASTVLRRLLSQPLLSGDIRSQMEAYIALPDPNLILHFRKIRGEQGDTVDLRDVLRRYARERLHPKVQQQLGLA